MIAISSALPFNLDTVQAAFEKNGKGDFFNGWVDTLVDWLQDAQERAEDGYSLFGLEAKHGWLW